MKNRRFIVIMSLVLVLVLALCLCACDPKDTDPDSGGTQPTPTPTPTPDVDPPSTEVEQTITYEATEGIIYSSSNPTKATKGSSVVFEFTIDVFYTGEPMVMVNNVARQLDYDEDTYTYSCKVVVRNNITVSISGITKAESSLLTSGTGQSDSPFVIKEPIDLLTMAETINSGRDDIAMSILGYYVLDCDLDFRGQEIPIIGDGSNSSAFFGGYFNGSGHTISNFKISSDSNDYVGLFGVVQAYDMLGFTGGTIFNLKLSDFTVTARNTGRTVACGAFVGQGFGATLVLCQAINGTVDVLGNNNYFSYAGGIIGLQRTYEDPFMSKLVYCSTQNVDIVCSSGTTYAAGGIAGYVYSEVDTILSTITNCYSTGNVSGAFHAGGIVGWLSNYTSITACYSTGDIHAQSHISDLSIEQYCHSYAGGLVGMAQLDTVVADSFATGSISASAALGATYTHTDSFVGRFEDVSEGLYGARTASVFNCYYAKDGKADSIDLTAVTTIKEKLYWHDVDWLFEDGAYPVINDEVNVSNGDDDETTHYTYNITVDFNGKTDKDGAGFYKTSFTDQYESIGYWYQIYAAYLEEDEVLGVPETIIASDGYISYGYYFDRECTIAVPVGFVAMRDITVYAAFANNSEIAGTYYVIPSTENEDSNNKTIELILNTDCSFVCTDMYGSYEGTYVYNGEYIVFENARFARYYGEGTYVNHQAYTFKAVKDGDNLKVFGALYTDEDTSETTELVPEESPLKLVKQHNAVVGSYYYTNGTSTVIYEFFANGTGIYSENGSQSELTYTISVDGNTLYATVNKNEVSISLANGVPTSVSSNELKPADSFRGKWQLSALPNKYIEFDGAGNWRYTCYIYVVSDDDVYTELDSSLSGKYTASNGTLVLDNGAIAIIENGFIKLSGTSTTQIYGGLNGYYGTWTSSDASTSLELFGININGQGEARISYITDENGRKRIEAYTLSYAVDMLNEGYICLFYEGEYYGTVTYRESNGSLVGSIYSLTLSDFASVSFYRIDEYEGEWISGDSVLNILDFNGYGVYTGIKNVPLEGIITIDNQQVKYTLDDFSLTGLFTYNGVIYNISLDEGRSIITISTLSGDEIATLIKKDELANKLFVDENGKEYTFDGRGALNEKGTLTISSADDTSQDYAYAIESDGTISIYSSDTKVGGVAIVGEEGSRNYVLSISGSNVVLSERTAFTGEWALASSFDAPLVIGTMNYDGRLTGSVPLSINGEDTLFNADFVMLDENSLVCEVNDFNLYIVKIKDGMFVISKHLNWFNYENDDDDSDGTTEWNYSYAMDADILRGKWTNYRNSQVYIFDGMGLNPEALGVYALTNIYATADDDETEYYYYGYFERKDGTGSDFVIFNDYSMLFSSAVKVVWCKEVSDSSRADQYKNEDGTRAFVFESVDPDDYTLTRR